MRSVFAISKELPFSNEAVKQERNKVFALCTQFGLPTGLLTVSPQDLDNLTMYAYAMENVEQFLPAIHSADRVAMKSVSYSFAKLQHAASFYKLDNIGDENLHKMRRVNLTEFDDALDPT